MSGGQYELKRRKEADNNRSQSGLELDVIDHYNGSERSVKSLSAENPSRRPSLWPWGSPMKCSLPQEEFGWTPCLWMRDSGSLDEESLAQAIRALTGLTEGKRLVGIISHVTELKEKIDKQIIVTKEKTGGSRADIVV